jgi:hypothetical protein
MLKGVSMGSRIKDDWENYFVKKGIEIYYNAKSNEVSINGQVTKYQTSDEMREALMKAQHDYESTKSHNYELRSYH